MRYINKKTGAILDSPCFISGGDWIPYEAYKGLNEAESNEASDKEVKENNETVEDNNDLTKAEIMNELDALGIKYDKRAKKEELYQLMMGE